MILKKKLKILHIITRLDAGGSAYNTLETVARLDKDKYETILIMGKTKDPHRNVRKFLKEHNINYFLINSLRRDINPFPDIIAYFELYKLIKEIKPDIVHTHTSKAGVLGRWAAYFNGVKYIIHTPHGHIFYGYFSKITTSFFIFVERLTAKVTDKIISLTDIGKREYIHFKIAKPVKFVTIYSGIEIEQFKLDREERKELIEKYSIPEDHFIFGTVTRLDQIKGNKYLIQAFAQVLKSFPDTILVIVGEGSERKYLKEIAKKFKVGKRIIFAGFQQNVAKFINIMDVFVLASLNEGMGRVILEAMACGKPVISTRTGGIPELIVDGQQGILVPTRDPENLAEAMIDLRKNKKKIKQLSESARHKVNEKFSVQKMIADIEKLYDQLTKRKKTKQGNHIN